jgi:hypothetical protein
MMVDGKFVDSEDFLFTIRNLGYKWKQVINDGWFDDSFGHEKTVYLFGIIMIHYRQSY